MHPRQQYEDSVFVDGLKDYSEEKLMLVEVGCRRWSNGWTSISENGGKTQKVVHSLDHLLHCLYSIKQFYHFGIGETCYPCELVGIGGKSIAELFEQFGQFVLGQSRHGGFPEQGLTEVRNGG